MVKEDAKSQSYAAYMARVSDEQIPVYRPSMDNNEIDNLKQVVNSNWISEGEFTRSFESQLAEICDRKYALAFSNATAALISGMKSVGIGKDSRVVVPSFAHSADPNSISATGSEPVFADVNKDTMCLSVDEIDKVIDENVKAVLFISAYGNAEGIDEVQEYCKDKNLVLINDSAPALFGEYKNKPIASYGDFSVLSFFADKTITTGEGGMLLTNQNKIIMECNIYKHDGRKERGHDLIERRGYNFRLTEFQSAVGVAQLSKGPYFAKKKKEILKNYISKIDNMSEINIFNFGDDIVPHRIVAITDKSEKLIDYLVSNGIGARTLFKPMHSQPCYGISHSYPNSELLFEKGLELPSYPDLTDIQIDYICNTIKEYYGVI